VPEPDNPQTDHKLKLLHSEEVKGAVTAMSALNGYLLTCVGTKVVVRSFEDNETLTGIAFIDVQIYVTSVKVVKNTIMLADAYKSVWFVGFQVGDGVLFLWFALSHDCDPSVTLLTFLRVYCHTTRMNPQNWSYSARTTTPWRP